MLIFSVYKILFNFIPLNYNQYIPRDSPLEQKNTTGMKDKNVLRSITKEFP